MSAILYNQNGFRPGRSTITQALALRRILEGVKHYHLPSIMEFIEFTKAFDSINHQEMSKDPFCLWHPGENYQYNRANVKQHQSKGCISWRWYRLFSNSFWNHAGVNLAPYLFVIELDCARLCNEASHTRKRGGAWFYSSEEIASHADVLRGSSRVTNP